MIKTIGTIFVFLCSTLVVHAETVALSGTVKKSGNTTGIKGVKVWLAKLPHLNAITDTSGAFSISGSTTSVRFSTERTASPQLILKGSTIVFSPAAAHASGCVEVFSSNGQRKSTILLNDPATQSSVSLPEFSSGITILRITVGSESFTRTLMRIGKDLFLKSENLSIRNDARLALAKLASQTAIDTLVAAKDGYIPRQVPIDGYAMKNIAVLLDSNGSTAGKCTREVLQEAINSYITAQKAGDPTKMSLASQVKYIQNMKDITADKSIVKTALPTIASQRDIIDVDSCRTFTELIVTAGSHPYVIGTRLKVDDGKISEISSMVSDKGDWLFDAAKYLSNSKDESWDILPVAKQCSRQALINAGNAYFDLIFDWTKDTIPWDDQCYRIEGGSAVAKPCTQGTSGNSVKTTCRTYVVDVDKGSVNLFCYFGYGPDSHLFRLESGKVRYIHTITACGDTVAAGKDCWGTAAKGKAKGYCSW